jgi:hypothetical protein
MIENDDEGDLLVAEYEHFVKTSAAALAAIKAEYIRKGYLTEAERGQLLYLQQVDEQVMGLALMELAADDEVVH